MGTGPRIVSVKSLSRRPGAPASLEAVLKRNFPRRARIQGIPGVAKLSVRVLPDGRLARLKVLRETGAYGFGDACIRTLRAAGLWKPPLDRAGKPVGTDITFECTFDVGY